MRVRAHESQALSRSILEVLWRETDYTNRIDLLLATVSELTMLPYCYLYLADSDSARFHLVQSRTRPPQDNDRRLAENGEDRSAAPAEGSEPTTAGGAESHVPMPALDLLRSSEDDKDRVVPTPVGALYSFALIRDGAAIGLIQVGPVTRRDVPRGVRRRLAAARFALSLVVQQTREEHELELQLGALAARLDVGHKLAGSALDLERFVRLLVKLALTSTGTEAGFVAILDPGSGELSVQVAENMPAGFADTVDLTPATGLFDWSLSEAGALILRDVEATAAFGIRSMLAVPLLAGDEPLGIFALANFGKGETFDEGSLKLLETFSEQIKLMIGNDRLFQSFTQQYIETLKGLACSLDVRRPETDGHHEAVSRVADAIARELGLEPAAIEAIRLAGLIHDVGIAGAAQVDDGFEADVEHPTVGASLIDLLPLDPAVGESIAMHHEWHDGWGVPNGLRGDEISLPGRVLAIAEFIVEMSTADPVREPWPVDRLVAAVEQRSGSQFHPVVAEAAIRLIPSFRADDLPKPSTR